MFVLCFLFLKDIANFYMSWFDPVYAYLFNGTNLAQGIFDIGHIDHPGTPLQILCAIIIRITFFFQDNSSLVEDVLYNPEHYLQVISLILISLNVLAVFVLGFVILKRTNNIKTAFFLQFTPIISMVSMFFMPIIACESFLVFCGVYLVLITFLYTYTENTLKPRSYILWFSFISGLLLAIKISSFPLIIIPLFLLKGVKNKILYFFSTILLFFVFILPIIPQYANHFNFLNNILTHTGRYGAGAKGIIEYHLFISNILNILSEEFPFTITFFGLLITCLLITIKKKWFINIDKKQKKLVWGIFIMFVIQIIIVAKHYSFHYLIPVYSFVILGLYAIIKLYLPLFKNYPIKIKTYLLVIIASIVLSGFTTRLYVRYHFYPNLYNPMYNTKTFLEKYNNTPKIIIPLVYGCALKESALYFGMVYSGNQKTKYAQLLKKKYPDTYFFLKDRGIFDWQKNIMKNELFSKYNQFIIYTKGSDKLALKENIKALLDINSNENLLSLSEIYTNPINEETIYLLISDTNKIKNLTSLKLDIFCNLEQLDSNKTSFVDSTRKYLFEKGNLQSSENPYSGKYSIKLTKDLPYGLDIRLKLIQNTFFKITVWRKSQSKNGVIVACSNDPTFYKNSTNVIESKSNGWELVELTFDISKDIPDNEIHIYVWNNGNDVVYFDDIHIQEYY